jgi:hypothetical protein
MAREAGETRRNVPKVHALGKHAVFDTGNSAEHDSTVATLHSEHRLARSVAQTSHGDEGANGTRGHTAHQTSKSSHVARVDGKNTQAGVLEQMAAPPPVESGGFFAMLRSLRPSFPSFPISHRPSVTTRLVNILPRFSKTHSKLAHQSMTIDLCAHMFFFVSQRRSQLNSRGIASSLQNIPS